MKTQRFLLLIGLPALFLFSCTIEKRVYLPGYHIESARHRTTYQKERSEQAENQPGDSAVRTEQTTPPHREPEPAFTADLPQRSVNSPAPVIPAEEAVPLPPVAPDAHSGRLEHDHHAQWPKTTDPGAGQSIRPGTDHSSAVNQADSRNRAGLLLAPLRIIFTLLLIALVIVGVVLLFVLESALGGTVLLAAGAVLLILILL